MLQIFPSVELITLCQTSCPWLCFIPVGTFGLFLLLDLRGILNREQTKYKGGFSVHLPSGSVLSLPDTFHVWRRLLELKVITWGLILSYSESGQRGKQRMQEYDLCRSSCWSASYGRICHVMTDKLTFARVWGNRGVGWNPMSRPCFLVTAVKTPEASDVTSTRWHWSWGSVTWQDP